MSSKQSQLSGAEGKTMVAGTEGMISCPPTALHVSLNSGWCGEGAC